MNGLVDAAGRALLDVELRSTVNAAPSTLTAWIDTGFTGELVLPRKTIDALALIQSGTVDAVLADGSQLALATYTCQIEWFGRNRRLEVIAGQGEFPLLGVGLLVARELNIDYRRRHLTLT
jgi:clan AA aspartic protease